MATLLAAMDSDGDVQQHWMLQAEVNGHLFCRGEERRCFRALVTGSDGQSVGDLVDMTGSEIDRWSRLSRSRFLRGPYRFRL